MKKSRTCRQKGKGCYYLLFSCADWKGEKVFQQCVKAERGKSWSLLSAPGRTSGGAACSCPRGVTSAVPSDGIQEGITAPAGRCHSHPGKCQPFLCCHLPNRFRGTKPAWGVEFGHWSLLKWCWIINSKLSHTNFKYLPVDSNARQELSVLGNEKYSKGIINKCSLSQVCFLFLFSYFQSFICSHGWTFTWCFHSSS